MQTTTPYQRLSSTEREEISRGLAQGTGLSVIARRLGRAPSTVTRAVLQWQKPTEVITHLVALNV